jgi:hypothetical protein
MKAICVIKKNKMKKILLLMFILALFTSCNNRSKAQTLREIQPEILVAGVEAIKINNVSDDTPYSEYTVTLNGIYSANLLRKPNIEKGDWIEIPFDIFGLPEGIKINSLTFSMPNCLDYVKFIDIQLPPPNHWKITEREEKDSFGDKTGRIIKGIRYSVEGTYTSSRTQYQEMKINISLSTEVPGGIGVYAFDGRNSISLTDGVFSYKIGDKIYDSFDYRNIGGPSINPTGSVKDETKSFLYFLKQGGNIRVQVYKDQTTYNFTVDADGFKESYSEALAGSKWGRITYYYVVPDRNNRNVEVEFSIEYTWSYEKEELYKNNPQLEEYIRNFFRTRNVNDANDGRGYYRREFVQENWGKPILQQMRIIFFNENIEYNYDNFRAWKTY